MNRSDFRKGGLQGRKSSTENKKGERSGRVRGSFLGRSPSLSYLPTAMRRLRLLQGRLLMDKPARLPGRSRMKRTVARVRAR